MFRTINMFVLETIAKPRHVAASVLCKVLGYFRRIFMKIIRISYLSHVFISLRCELDVRHRC